MKKRTFVLFFVGILLTFGTVGCGGIAPVSGDAAVDPTETYVRDVLVTTGFGDELAVGRCLSLYERWRVVLVIPDPPYEYSQDIQIIIRPSDGQGNAVVVLEESRYNKLETIVTEHQLKERESVEKMFDLWNGTYWYRSEPIELLTLVSREWRRDEYVYCINVDSQHYDVTFSRVKG